jgi:serine protease AprX
MPVAKGVLLSLPQERKSVPMHVAAKPLRSLLVVVFLSIGLAAPSGLGAVTGQNSKLDPLLQQRATLLTGTSRIIVTSAAGATTSAVASVILLAGGTPGRTLPIIDAQVAEVPNAALPLLAASSLISHLSLDRLVVGAMERTGQTVGATAVRQELGYDGAGVGVAVIDSGITSWHDDLADGQGGAQRVDQFVDLVTSQTAAYDDYGHGTHVAGIIAGNGFDSGGARSGIAPRARLIVLKALDGTGRGRISDVIAALGYVLDRHDALNIRVVNLSVATGVYESYNVDPLTLAAQRVVGAGVVVVAAAGNYGHDSQGHIQYGGVTAPGNAPWVLTVGASSHMGTPDRTDDTMALFSSRGPTAIDRGAKPDVVAPGVGIESLSDPNSAFYSTRSPYLLNGTVATSYLPYLSLSGTSMATPVVTGTVALMLQANPTLRPNEVKAIIESTAEFYPAYDRLTQGSGFLNAKAAVEMARRFAPVGGAFPVLNPPSTTVCDVLSCNPPTSLSILDTGGAGSQTVVWGTTSDGETVVWGTTDGETVVWGTNDGETVVWGTSCTDPSCEPVVWNKS